jgi:hypothetical protein
MFSHRNPKQNTEVPSNISTNNDRRPIKSNNKVPQQGIVYVEI